MRHRFEGFLGIGGHLYFAIACGLTDRKITNGIIPRDTRLSEIIITGTLEQPQAFLWKHCLYRRDPLKGRPRVFRDGVLLCNGHSMGIGAAVHMAMIQSTSNILLEGIMTTTGVTKIAAAISGSLLITACWPSFGCVTVYESTLRSSSLGEIDVKVENCGATTPYLLSLTEDGSSRRIATFAARPSSPSWPQVISSSIKVSEGHDNSTTYIQYDSSVLQLYRAVTRYKGKTIAVTKLD